VYIFSFPQIKYLEPSSYLSDFTVLYMYKQSYQSTIFGKPICLPLQESLVRVCLLMCYLVFKTMKEILSIGKLWTCLTFYFLKMLIFNELLFVYKGIYSISIDFRQITVRLLSKFYFKSCYFPHDIPFAILDLLKERKHSSITLRRNIRSTVFVRNFVNVTMDSHPEQQ
jgi:hypothetical protein